MPFCGILFQSNYILLRGFLLSKKSLIVCQLQHKRLASEREFHAQTKVLRCSWIAIVRQEWNIGLTIVVETHRNEA